MNDLKTVLEKIVFHDDAGVRRQLADQLLSVKLRLARVRYKVLILSGKGGVGKSAVTTQLAVALARLGRKVAILDADLNGPCVPKMLGLSGRRLAFDAEGARPPEGPLGIRVASLAFLLEERQPTRWKGPMDLTPAWLGIMEASVLRELLADVIWGELDFLLFDLPPGAAADKPPALLSLIPELDGAVVVTTPSSVAAEVVGKSIAYARGLGMRPLGLVENMSGARCPHCGGAVHPFGTEAAAALEGLGLPWLARIPLDAEFAESLDKGAPLDAGHRVSRVFSDLAGKLQDCLAQPVSSATSAIGGTP